MDRLSGIVVGAIFCVVFEATWILLGLGLGLGLFPFERVGESWKWIGLGVGSAIYVTLSIAISYFLGGFIACRLYPTERKAEHCFQGLATWGLATLMAFWINYHLFSPTLNGVERGAGSLAAIEFLIRTHPQVITDFSILKGKVVTSFKFNKSPEQILKTIRERDVEHEVTKQVIEQGRKALAATCLATFFGVLIGMLFATLGSWWGAPKFRAA